MQRTKTLPIFAALAAATLGWIRLPGSPVEAALSGTGFYNRAKFFDAVHGYATLGGNDSAELTGSDLSDTFAGTSTDGALYGSGFYNRAKGFDEVHGYANAGHDVAFIARGAHLEALRNKGLLVKSVHGDFTLPSVNATDRPAEIGSVELIVVCVKTLATEAAVMITRSEKTRSTSR